MDPLTIVLCTTAGAVVGTSVGILLLHRKLRPPISETELAGLRLKVETTNASLTDAIATMADQRKQLATRDQTIQQNREAFEDKQRQYDLVAVEVQREMAQRSAAEQKTKELT